MKKILMIKGFSWDVGKHQTLTRKCLEILIKKVMQDAIEMTVKVINDDSVKDKSEMIKGLILIYITDLLKGGFDKGKPVDTLERGGE